MKRTLVLLAALTIASCGYIPRSADNIAPDSPTPPPYFTPYESPDVSPNSSPTDSASAQPSPSSAPSPAPAPAPVQQAPAAPAPPPPTPPPYVVRIVIVSTLYPPSSTLPNGAFGITVQAFYSDGSDHGNAAVLGACGQVVTNKNTYSGCTAAPPAWTYRNAYMFAGLFATPNETVTSVTMSYKGVSASCTPPCGL